MNYKITRDFLKKNPGWNLSKNRRVISRTFSFKNFKDALRFIQGAGQSAEEMRHHPDIALRKYRFVTFRLTTHACQGLSTLDFRFARKAQQIYLSLI